MHHYLATLLLPFIFIYACCVESRPDHRLAPRVLSATDLFSFNSAGSPGSCTPAQKALVSSWIADAITLNNVALSAYGFGMGRPDAIHLSSIMGIRFLGPGRAASSGDATNYAAMGDHLQNVQQFLTGNGVPGAKDRTRPLFFCSDDFGQYVPWDQPAKDKNGQSVENPLTDEPFTIGQLFPTIVNGMQGIYPIQPFWAKIFNGYVFMGSDSQKCCSTGVFAGTPRSRASEHVISGIDIQLGQFERFTYFCAKGWNARPGTTNPRASLADILTYNNYPTGGSTAQNLGDFMPISSTFYHELFHLTDSEAARTDDPYSGVNAIFTAANPADAGVRSAIITNPESYNFFAVASYLARNPPQTPQGSPQKLDVVFLAGLPELIQ